MKSLLYYINAATGRIVTSSGADQQEIPEWVLGDRMEVSFQFLTVTSDGVTPYPLSGVYFRFGAKAEKKYTGPFVLFSDASDIAVSATSGLIICTINLNTTALSALLNPGSDGLDDATINAEVEMTDADGNISTIAKFKVSALNDVIKGTEGDPESTTPDTVSVEEFQALLREVTHPTEGFYKIESGMLWLWDVELQKFSPCGLNENGFAVLEEA